MWYKIGWYQNGKREYVTVKSKEDLVLEILEKINISDSISVKVLAGFTLKEEKNEG